MSYKNLLNMKPKMILFVLLFITLTFSEKAIRLHYHQWCPPCKKAKAIFQKLKKIYPEINFQSIKYVNNTLLAQRQTKKQLPFPTIVFECSKLFRYQNDLTLSQLSYWIEVACQKKIPECTDQINRELYRIIMEKVEVLSPQLLKEIMSHPHIKICSSQSSNTTSQKVIQILKNTDKKSLYFDYFSNNIRNYLIQSQKTAIAIITNQKNTSRVNSFLQAYMSLNNFVDEEVPNITKIQYRYQLPEKHKEEVVFLELCQNSNISKCIYQSQRKHQVQQNQKMIEKLWHFLDVSPENTGDEQIIAFRFQYPHFQKHFYHNFGALDQKFLFWINQIMSKEDFKAGVNICYLNALSHRVSEASLSDIESHLKLSKYFNSRKQTNAQSFLLNKIVSSYHSQPKMTLCFQGKKPIFYHSNKEIGQIIGQIKAFDKSAYMDEL